MQSEYEIVKQVYAAKADMQKADELIRAYIPFIRSEASRFLSRFCTESDDEFSIAMIAFHEAVCGYEKDRGAFLNYASMLIRSRLTDYCRSEARHIGVLSLDEESGEGEVTLIDTVADSYDPIGESVNLQAAKQEIAHLAQVMAEFGVNFGDVSENSPKQERTLEACKSAVAYAAEHRELLEELLKTKKLPLAKLAKGSGVGRKTLERHRKYILVMLLAQTNGYEIIRSHLRHTVKTGGGQPK